MAKKRLLLLVILSLLFTMASCGWDYAYQLDESKHNVIEEGGEDIESSYLIYQGEKYVYIKESDCLSVSTENYQGYDDILLSWNGHRYIGYIDEYYSYDTEKPVYIYCERVHRTYFREDYDFREDTFVIKDTDEEIVWKDLYGPKKDNLRFEPQVKVWIYSKQYPRIKTRVDLAMIDGIWYMSLTPLVGSWVVSDEFVSILSEKGII